MIIYRGTKGVLLTAAELDANFLELDNRLADQELYPPEAILIDHFVVEGTLLTIVMSNGDTHGPFVLPTAQWRWTGEFQGDITYLPGDIFTNAGDVYFVRVMHESVTPFDPGLFTVDGFVYVKILSRALQPYDVGLFFNDIIGSGPEVLGATVAARDFTLYPDFLNSQAYLQVATSTSSIALPIYKNETTVIGTITFTPGLLTTPSGGQFGVFNAITPGVGIVIVKTDRLSIVQPYEDDDTAAGLMVTLVSLAVTL